MVGCGAVKASFNKGILHGLWQSEVTVQRCLEINGCCPSAVLVIREGPGHMENKVRVVCTEQSGLRWVTLTNNTLEG